MDPKTNPYAPGTGTRPPELAGRDDIIKECDVALARVLMGRPARGILLTGLRGVGKTVLLNVIRDQAAGMKYQVDLLEAPEGSPLAPQIIPSLRQILLRLSHKAKAGDIVQRALRVLKSFQISANVGGADFGLKVDPEIGTADSGVVDRDLSELLVSVGEAARAESTGVAILIDEVQYLNSSDLSSLIVAVHRVTQRQLPIIVIGAGLPSIPGLSGDAKSYAERLFRYPPIGALNTRDARAALVEPAEKLGVSFKDAALDEIVRVTEGYPYFIQEWGSVVWDLSKGPTITSDDVKKGEAEATKRLDESFFRVRLNRVTDAEQRYMRAMSELGSGNYKSGDVAKILGKNTNSFGPVRDGLIRKEMIYSSKHGTLDFTVPLFDQFMRRSLPTL
jgi:hypothetical protein